MAAHPSIGDVINGKWRIFRTWAASWQQHHYFMVQNTETEDLAFCELESTTAEVNLLRYITLVTDELSRTHLMSMPKFVEHGNWTTPHGQYTYLCTSPTGPSLQMLWEALPPMDGGQRFSMFTSLHIGLEMLLSLMEFHNAGYLHRDLKPEIFILNCSSPAGNLMLMLDLLRRWRQLDDSGGLPERPVAPFRGNLRYASVNALRQNDQSRSDDLWSWFYVMVELTTGSLPFQTWLVGNDIYEQLANFADAKTAGHANFANFVQLQSAPHEFRSVFEYLSTLSFESVPDYNRLLRLIRGAMRRASLALNGNVKLDWEPGGLYYNQLRRLL